MIPNLANAGAKQAWHRMEIAKRRLLYTLLGLGLPVETKTENPDRGLAFDFLADGADSKVFTGHDEGLITINLAEADDPFGKRCAFTWARPIGRCSVTSGIESGHYYWERLVVRRPGSVPFPRAVRRRTRKLRAGPRAALSAGRARRLGGSPRERLRHHAPWEDWAETWAHYLHIVDGLQTARAHGLSLQPMPADGAPGPSLTARRLDLHSFDDLMNGWIPVTVALNSMNRSFGTPDPYPFVLAPPATEKLRFVHGVVQAHAEAAAVTSRLQRRLSRTRSAPS
jgi:hypothetical protein